MRPMKKKSHKRSFIISTAIFSLMASSVISTPANAAPNEWIIVGSGWGHGVGLSQYGALGQALEGKGWQDIVAHYYPGTNLSDSPVDKQVASLLELNQTEHLLSQVVVMTVELNLVVQEKEFLFE